MKFLVGFMLPLVILCASFAIAADNGKLISNPLFSSSFSEKLNNMPITYMCDLIAINLFTRDEIRLLNINPLNLIGIRMTH